MLTSALLCSLSFPIGESGPGLRSGDYFFVQPHGRAFSLRLSRYSEDISFDSLGALDVWRRASEPMEQLARGQAAALASATQDLAARMAARMRVYRDDRIESMFMEERPLSEQLQILKQRLKENP